MAEVSFDVWLRAAAEAAGVRTPAELQQLLVGHNSFANEATVTRWLEGAAEPSFDKTREVIRALNQAAPKVDMWEEYRNYLEGRPFFQDSRKSSQQEEEKLEDLTKSSRLPPPLSE